MKKWVWILFVANLGIRLALVNWNAAEYTDSIRWMTDLEWFRRVDWERTAAGWKGAVADWKQAIGQDLESGRGLSGFLTAPRFFLRSAAGQEVRGSNDPPLYPASILLFSLATRDRELAGKLVSMLAAALTVFPLYFLARRVYGDKVGLYTLLLYTVSPLVLRWSIRVMGEALYTLPVVLCLWLFMEYVHSHRLKHLFGFFLVAGLAPFAHVPGRVLIVPAVFLFAWFFIISLLMAFRSSPRWKAFLKAIGLTLLVLVMVGYVWALKEIWNKWIANNWWYEQSMVSSLDSLRPRLQSWLKEYALIYPYVLGYPLAAFLLVGLVRSFLPLFKPDIRKAWGALFIIYVLVIFAGVVINKWWTPRYLYSIVPISLVVVAYGLEAFRARLGKVELGTIFLALCLLFSLAFSAAALRCSRDSFGDVKRTALFLRDDLKRARVWTDETVKTGWWAQRHLIGYRTQNRHEVRPGDYVVLHSWGGTDIPRELNYLRGRFDFEIAHEERAEVVPLLADDILFRGANAPEVARHRFERQNFQTLVVKIVAARGEVPAPVQEGAAIGGGMITAVKKQPGHNVQVWKIKPERKRGDEIVVALAHAEPGREGGFAIVAYADTDGDGNPDRLLAQSDYQQVKEAGTWSSFTFRTTEPSVFVGNAWTEPATVYYDRGPWPGELLEDTMHYSNQGGVPDRKVEQKITNLLIYFPGAEAPGK